MVRLQAMMRLLLPILGKLQTKIMLRQTKNATRIQNSSNATIKIIRSRHRSFRFRCLCSVFCHSLLLLSFSSCAEQRPAYSNKAVHGVKVSIGVQQHSVQSARGSPAVPIGLLLQRLCVLCTISLRDELCYIHYNNSRPSSR
jgi:hypothetical protein